MSDRSGSHLVHPQPGTDRVDRHRGRKPSFSLARVLLLLAILAPPVLLVQTWKRDFSRISFFQFMQEFLRGNVTLVKEEAIETALVHRYTTAKQSADHRSVLYSCCRLREAYIELRQRRWVVPLWRDAIGWFESHPGSDSFYQADAWLRLGQDLFDAHDYPGALAALEQGESLFRRSQLDEARPRLEIAAEWIAAVKRKSPTASR